MSRKPICHCQANLNNDCGEAATVLAFAGVGEGSPGSGVGAARSTLVGNF
jgi:hypothetical protein